MMPEVHKEIRTLFELANFSEPTITITEDEEISLVLLEITTKDENLFFNNNKELLFAFQYLFKKILQKKHPHIKNFVIDINGEQKKHINEAKQKARIAYQRVLQYKKPYEFGYLNGFERMVIHLFLQEKNDVSTDSKGIGLERRLTISPKS